MTTTHEDTVTDERFAEQVEALTRDPVIMDMVLLVPAGTPLRRYIREHTVETRFAILTNLVYDAATVEAGREPDTDRAVGAVPQAILRLATEIGLVK